MATSTYDEALARLLVHEGGYTNHPSDPGGPTNFGITIHDYRRHVKPDATAADVRAMRIEQAKRIYRAKYWDALACDRLPAGLDYALFDYGVNSGIGRAGRVLRRVLGLADDGHAVSDAVLAAVAAREPRALVAAVCDERLRFLQRLSTWPVFGAGWGRRVAEVRARALALAARGAAASPPVDGAPAPGKGTVPAPRASQRGSAAGSVVAGAAAARQAAEAGADPLVVAALVGLGLALAVGAWLGWRRWRARRQLAPA